jgi:hypothetical protein
MRSLILAFLLSCGIAAAQSGYGKTIYFSGRAWKVKIASPPTGPGPNYFSDSANNVWVDTSGRLHLKIAKSGPRWICAEVVSQESFGHGVYRFYLDSRVDQLDRNVVLGLFTWNDDPAYNHRELDIEFARWGANTPVNAQYVVQPYDTPGNLMNFVQPAVTQSTHGFDWRAGGVTFQSLRGHAAAPSSSNPIIAQQLFVNGIPPAGGENARINLWLFNGKAPSNRKAVEVIVNRFEFVPQ